MAKKYDFSGWATRNDLRCSDGRTIRRDAFKNNDGKIVPLVWQHMHDDPSNILGHALLENRNEGVYAYCSFNESEKGQEAKLLVDHGDINSLSIFAGQLKQNGGDVLHGDIKEVSLVLAGANPGAYIDSRSFCHSDEPIDEDNFEAIIFNSEEELSLIHEDQEEAVEEEKTEEVEEVLEHEDKANTEEKKEEEKMAESEKTVQDVFNELTEEQKNVVYFMIGQALEDAKNEAKHSDEGEDEMKYNVFDNSGDENTLAHMDFSPIFSDAKKYGSLKDSFLAHADEYGITNIDYLFPDAQAMEKAPGFIKRPDEWVDELMKGTHHTPFSRIKSMFADITYEEARARGYIKGRKKKEEVFALLKRTTTPTTIYKKQKLDRDDIIDIADFDVVSWLKTEMRMMLDEEIARAVLLGDGRDASSDDKISELNIRPIAKDDPLFTIKAYSPSTPGDPDQTAKDFIKAVIKARIKYRGSGNPIMFTTEEFLTDMLLIEDGIGHPLYDTVDKLATKLRVRKIVTVPVLEGYTIDDVPVKAIIVNPADYNIGADKGGAINMFDDFDIDYNQQKYLIETRCSGALVKPFSAIVVFDDEDPENPDNSNPSILPEGYVYPHAPASSDDEGDEGDGE